MNRVHIYYLSDKTDWHRTRHSADAIFEVVSAAANVGISTGFVNPGMSPAAKWLFIVVMWAGRLEIVPVIALAAGAVRRV
ncbi:potassium transporter TrkG [Methanoculleus receptaculi]|uniref:Potassium transporter TrkG n=1 Tax=Methanoculleus receptaculi TaxID=394967 RepID=A0AAX4FUC0_9EURY|nr:potassium transporter TrkG [Methanoculleus receptaculi]MDK2990154.1 trk/ktr system potassium uptake protein [Methanoculleus sp.]WOX57464.1 potassium transporter TrkG [Methanoculleus receptaculi]